MSCCDLTEFSALPLDQLTAELERMLANHHAPMRSYASRNISTPVAPTDCPEASPSGRVVAGNSIKEFA